jgi:uncharacterized protein
MDTPVSPPHDTEAAAPAHRRRQTYTLKLVVLGEGSFLYFGLLWMYWRELPFRWSDPSRVSFAGAIGIGLLTAAGCAAMAFVLLRVVPERGPVRPLRRLYREVLFPLFRGNTALEVAAISVFAGVGEEVLFRGAVQPELGLIATSLVFGALHTAGRATVALGIYAACMGALLGWLTIATGGLLAPIVAHMVYDALAISYLRWGPALPEPGAAGPMA